MKFSQGDAIDTCNPVEDASGSFIGHETDSECSDEEYAAITKRCCAKRKTESRSSDSISRRVRTTSSSSIDMRFELYDVDEEQQMKSTDVQSLTM